jgi:predicted DCC family thiol-disulfide oxidoreductase YuxK
MLRASVIRHRSGGTISVDTYLLYDGACASCSKVARLVRESGVAGLDVRSLSDPDVLGWFGAAGLPAPDRPVLVERADGVLRRYAGMAMRLRLARLLGYRRAHRALRLLAAEAAARAQRAGAGAMSRRSLLGAGAGGATGLLLVAAGGTAAASDRHATGLVPADPAAVRQAMARSSVRQAVDVWGEVDPSHVMRVSGSDGTPVLLLPHAGTNVTTVTGTDKVDFALAYEPIPDLSVVRYYVSTGTWICDMTSGPDGTVVTPAPGCSAPTDPTGPGAPTGPLPAGCSSSWVRCFLQCLRRDPGSQCTGNCCDCVSVDAIALCAACSVCAGANGFTCAKGCL